MKNWLLKLWLCKLWKWHKWTCANEEGIEPTDKQVAAGLAGFYDYAKMYCDRCDHESKYSKENRIKNPMS